jgi:hypothetical protein
MLNGLHGTIGTLNGLHGTIRTEKTLNGLHGTVLWCSSTLQGLCLLGDSIYPSRHPIVIHFSSAQLHVRRQPENIKIHWKKIIKRIRRYRVFVEHAIHVIKICSVISTLYRHSRAEIRDIVCLCACLAIRRTKLFFS